MSKSSGDEDKFQNFVAFTKKKEDAISSLSIKFWKSVVIVDANPKLHITDLDAYVWQSDRIRWRSDQLDLIPAKQIVNTSFDGEKYYFYDLQTKYALVASNPNGGVEYLTEVDPLLLTWGKDSLSKLLSAITVSSQEKFVKDGKEFDRYTAFNERAAYIDYYSFVVAGEKNVVELQFVNFKKGANACRGWIYKVNASQTVVNGFTVPTSVQKESYILAKGKEPALQWFQNFVVKEATFNSDIPDQNFEPPFPVDTPLFYTEGISGPAKATEEPSSARNVSGEFFNKIIANKEVIKKEAATYTTSFKPSTFDPRVIPNFQ